MECVGMGNQCRGFADFNVKAESKTDWAGRRAQH